MSPPLNAAVPEYLLFQMFMLLGSRRDMAMVATIQQAMSNRSFSTQALPWPVSYILTSSRLPLAIESVILFSAVAWMALVEAIWQKRLPSPPVILAIVLTLGGVILVTGVWQESFNGQKLGVKALS